jgi:outer membrane receptor protein involved in Fe transport
MTIRTYRNKLPTAALAPLLLFTLAPIHLAMAQDASEQTATIQSDQDIEKIIVRAPTGSRLKRQGDTASPLSEYDASDLQSNGVNEIRDLVQLLPINAGSENNSDNLSQNFTAGTSNINLRGLGVASTLVLLNGKRQVLSAVQTDDGSSFVDTASLVPTLALERVEILKDGASAIYGSDAVAGVANFITRDGFEGAEFQAEYRARAGNGSQRDVNLDGVIGNTFDEGTFLLAVSYLDRTSLLLGEVDFLTPATSGFGNPASFVVPTLGLTVADPDCEANGGIFQSLANGSTQCRFDFGPQVTAVPTEQRLQAFARATWDWSEDTIIWTEVGYARNKISREVSPSFPVLNAPIVPASNPGNIFNEDVFFQGRPYGEGQPTEINFYDHNTVRFAIGAEGSINDDFDWDVSYVSASNDALLNPRDIIAANFQAALNGFGGSSCDTSPTASVAAVPGQGECHYFNPFSTSFNAAADSPLANDPSLRGFIVGDYIADAESEMNVIELNIVGSLFELDAGAVGFALGAQYRDQSLATSFDSITQQDGFGFLIGNPNFKGATDVTAVYSEVLVPLSDELELSGAVRYEDYGGDIGSTVDPKIALLYRPDERLSLRGSYSTSFRAPSVFQTQGVQTNFTNIRDTDGSSTFAGRRTVGDPSLKPETSTAINIGTTWRPTDSISIDLDYWNFSFEDVLLKENAQALVTANPNDPRIERTSAGTVSIVNTAFINADSIDTSGLDLSIWTSYTSKLGKFTPSFDGTYVLEYDVTNDGTKVDALGRLNRSNIGNPSPRFRGNLGLNWNNENGIGANIYLRHVSSYEDDGGVNIDSFTQVDAQFSLSLGEILRPDSETTLTLGVANATGENPPFVAVSGSYDPKTGDPRGRRVYARISASF